MVLVVRCLICGKELPYSQSDPSELINHVKTEHPFANKRSRPTHESSKKNVEQDLRQSLDLNSKAFKKQIDKEIQTEVRWKDLFKMSQANSPSLTPQSSDSRRRFSSNDFVPVTQRHSLPTKTHSSPAKITTDNKARFSELTPLKSKPPGESARIKNLGKDVKVLYEKKAGEGHQKAGDARQKRSSGDQLPSTSRKPRNSARFYKTSIEKWRPVGDEKIHCPRCQSFKRPIVRTHRERTTESSFLSTIFMTCWPCCLSPCIFPEPTRENLHCPVCNYHLGIFDHVLKVVRSNPDIAEEIP